jgi:hypothetical protein
MKICFFCKKEIDIEDKVGRAESCPFCRSDLHCCLNCRFYDEKAYNQCREPQAERVVEKDKANFCEYFSFRDSSSASPQEEARRKAKEQLDALFKK